MIDFEETKSESKFEPNLFTCLNHVQEMDSRDVFKVDEVDYNKNFITYKNDDGSFEDGRCTLTANCLNVIGGGDNAEPIRGKMPLKWNFGPSASMNEFHKLPKGSLSENIKFAVPCTQNGAHLSHNPMCQDYTIHPAAGSKMECGSKAIPAGWSGYESSFEPVCIYDERGYCKINTNGANFVLTGAMAGQYSKTGWKLDPNERGELTRIEL